jgi:putative ABC transport system permease protein
MSATSSTGHLFRDLKYAARLFTQQKGFTAAALLMLALGIGATTAIFSVVNAVLIKPLPYADSDALVNIVHNVNGSDLAYFSDVIYLAYADNNQTFDGFGVWSASTATVTGGGMPEQVRTLTVSREVLPVLGMQPALGRWFAQADGAEADNSVILTDGFWQRRLGGDRTALDRPLIVNGSPHQVIGVMPPAFQFGGESDLIVLQRIRRPGSRGFGHQGIARLKPGVTIDQANADINRMIPLWQKDTGPNRSRFAGSLRPLKQDIVGNIGPALWVILGTIGAVLLMACANVANLLLIRANARRQEFAIRAALGASRAGVARSLLVESLLLGLAGGALGLLIAYGAQRVLLAIEPANLPRLDEISINAQVLAFTVVVSIACGLVFGLIYAGAAGATGALGAGRTSTQNRERQRIQNTLVTMQIALALVLLVSSGLMIRSFQALRSVEPGFTEPHAVQTFSLFVPASQGTELNLEGGASTAADEQLARTQQAIVDTLAAIPGVESAAFTSYLSMDPDTSTRASDALEGEGGDNPKLHVSRQFRFISPGLFEAMGTRLVAGVDFTWTDIYDRRDVAIVSENFARELWGSAQAALGKRIRNGKSAWYQIVGVSDTIRDNGVDQPPPPMFFLPARHHPRIFGLPGYLQRSVTVLIRTERAATQGFVEQMHEAVWSVNPSLPLAKVRTFGDVYDRSMGRTSFTLVMLAIAGAMAMLLGLGGIYGVVAYAVRLRRREIAIRMALGSQARAIEALFMRRGIMMAIAGVVLGIAGAAATTRVLESLLFGIRPLDPLTFATMPIVLVIAALLATYLPARRALAVDPAETLKSE